MGEVCICLLELKTTNVCKPEETRQILPGFWKGKSIGNLATSIGANHMMFTVCVVLRVFGFSCLC